MRLKKKEIRKKAIKKAFDGYKLLIEKIFDGIGWFGVRTKPKKIKKSLLTEDK
jgi:hypothetical protein